MFKFKKISDEYDAQLSQITYIHLKWVLFHNDTNTVEAGNTLLS